MQCAPAAISFEQGLDQIVCMRLSPKGLYRFYARCCDTPLGNTVGPSIPFVGIMASAFGESADAHFGGPIGAISGKFAIGAPPPGSTGLNLRIFGRAMGKVLGWRLRGRTWPHPFFEGGKKEPRYPVTVLEKSERDRVRALAGPKPA